MTERPILFQGAMVRAILGGTKTQTRRICKANFISTGGALMQMTDDDIKPVLCPYARERGDRLWVRETWYCDDYRVQRGHYLKPVDMDLDEARNDGTLIYRASSGDRPYEAEQPVWRPAIHMPRWACRLVLEVTDVRVERLQDISEVDARAEGVVWEQGQTAANVFESLWESINGPRSWDTNPWVWVVEFRRLR